MQCECEIVYFDSMWDSISRLKKILQFSFFTPVSHCYFQSNHASIDLKNNQFRTRLCTHTNVAYLTEIGRKVLYAAREESRIRLLLLTFLSRRLIYCLLNHFSLFIFQRYRKTWFFIANTNEIHSIHPIHTLYYHPWFEKLLKNRFLYCREL